MSTELSSQLEKIHDKLVDLKIEMAEVRKDVDERRRYLDLLIKRTELLEEWVKEHQIQHAQGVTVARIIVALGVVISVAKILDMFGIFR